MCFRQGDTLHLRLADYDRVSDLVESGSRWFRCETVEGLECLVDLSGVDCVIGMTAEEVERQDAAEVTRG